MKKNRKNNRSEMDWQTGPFARRQNFVFHIPEQLLLLCKLMNITPEQLLKDFMDNISCGSWKRHGRDQVRQRVIEYFREHGYGKDIYSDSEIDQIFKELDAIGLLYPYNGSSETIDVHVKWREIYHQHWFDKWFHKDNRTLK